MPQQDVRKLLNDPVAQELLNSKTLARVAYIALDGEPRVIPIWFHWNGEQLILATAPTAPKVKALLRNPKVALTIDENTFLPKALLVRGTASSEIVDGIAPEQLEAAKKYLGEEQGRAWAEHGRGTYKQMARISIQPEWVKIFDFKTRFPKALADAMEEAKAR